MQVNAGGISSYVQLEHKVCGAVGAPYLLIQSWQPLVVAGVASWAWVRVWVWVCEV
jgi:hypothetical protein